MKFSTIFKSLFIIFLGILVANIAYEVKIPRTGGFEKKQPEQDTPFGDIEFYQDKTQTMPEMNIQTTQGDRFLLSEFQGKYLILNVWATWCAPCVKELPALKNLKAQLEPQGWHVVSISVDDDMEISAIHDFVEKHNVTDLAGFYDTSGKLLELAMQVGGVPLTYILSPEGKIIARVNGAAKWDSPAVIDYLKTLTIQE